MGSVGKIFKSLSGFNLIKGVLDPSKPKDPEALPEPVTRADPAIAAAKEKTRLSRKKRQGRAASVLTSASGAQEQLGSVKQASLGGSSVLG